MKEQKHDLKSYLLALCSSKILYFCHQNALGTGIWCPCAQGILMTKAIHIVSLLENSEDHVAIWDPLFTFSTLSSTVEPQ